MERIKILCGLLLIVFFGSLFQGTIPTIIEAVDYGLTIDAYENKTQQGSIEYFMMDVAPKNPNFVEGSTINLNNGQPLQIRTTNMSIILSDTFTQPLWWRILNATHLALSIVVLILGIWIPFLVVKILRSMQHSFVFERINLARMNRIGKILLGIGVLSTLIQFINIMSAEYIIEMTFYKFSYAKIIDFGALIMGIVVLLMTEIMRMAIEMKEEQDLTI